MIGTEKGAERAVDEYELSRYACCLMLVYLVCQRLRVGKTLVQYSRIWSLVMPACSPNSEHFSMYSSIEHLSRNSPLS